MKASVIIITKDQKHFLKKSLPILLKQNLKGGCEIIVVDSGSTDGAKEYALSMGAKLVEYKGKWNYARAANMGVKEARGKFVIRLSGDVIPLKKDFLSQMIKPFEDLKVGGVYGRYTISGKRGYGYPDFWESWRFPKKQTRYSVRQYFLMGLLGIGGVHVYNFAGGCCAIRREIWKKRGFNEKLIAGEDAEYAWFLHVIGYDIVCNPSAVVLHEHKIKRVKKRVKKMRTFLGLSRWQVVFT